MSMSTNSINAGEIVIAIVIRELKPDILRGSVLSSLPYIITLNITYIPHTCLTNTLNIH